MALFLLLLLLNISSLKAFAKMPLRCSYKFKESIRSSYLVKDLLLPHIQSCHVTQLHLQLVAITRKVKQISKLVVYLAIKFGSKSSGREYQISYHV